VTEARPVTVIVVSRGRPQALRRCLTAIGQLAYPLFEVVLVADPASVALLPGDLAGRIKVVTFDRPNISEARNLGIARSAGEIVAFVDDDAVPEPTWIWWLNRAFDDPAVMAAGGFVIGRNGISWQWQARDVRTDGRSQPLAVDPDAITVLTGRPGRGIKTEGTNMAFRRDLLVAMGGFDPAYRFYLDETDLNLRLARLGLSTAIVPRAVVHHGFAASARRRDDRVPRDLHEIGASLAVFLRKHGHRNPEARLDAELAEQRRRLLRHMVAGRLEPPDVGRILRSLRDGWEDGSGRAFGERPMAEAARPEPFRPYLRPNAARGHRILSAPAFRARRARRDAARLVAEGFVVSLYLFSLTPRYHRVSFDPAGFWVQRGGLFGRSVRSDRAIRLWSFGKRLHREVRRTAGVRWFEDEVKV
jgi:GT2 family glycosyltransferase